MRNLLIALCILFICTACPYESPVPISKRGDIFLEELVGKWQRQDENQNYYIVDALDKKTYKIVENAYNEESDSYDVSLYQGHINKINDSYFFNVTQYNPNEVSAASDEIMITAQPSYYLYKIAINKDGSFIMHPLSNYIKEEFERSKDLEKFVTKHMHLSFFYGEPEGFVRLNE